MPTLLINNLGGGVNEGVSPNLLQDREFESLINFLPFGNRLTRRWGLKRLSTGGAFGQGILGIWGYRDATGVYRVIVGGSTTLAFLNGGLSFTTLFNNDGVPLGAAAFNWCFQQYKNIVYGGKLGLTALVRISNAGQNFDVSGIVAPAAAATIADGGVGVVEAGNVYVVYTYYNTVTGAESNPSPPSLVLAHGANLVINWAGITVSADPQVNARRLYRTTQGSAVNGPRLFIGQINDNVTTIFVDNIPIAGMGDICKTIENTPPPAGAPIFALHKERMFYTDFITLYPSEVGLPESVDPTLAINVNPNDGQLIRALHSFQDRLIIGKTNKTYALSGVGRDDFAISVLSEDYGCFGHGSMQSVDGSLFWFAGSTVCRSDGVNVVSIADVKLKNTLASVMAGMTPTQILNVTAVIDPTRNLYILCLGAGGNLLYAYNYKTDAWSTIQVPIGGGGAINPVLADSWDANSVRQMYFSYGDFNLYGLFNPLQKDSDETTGLAGAATPISAFLKTKRYSPGGPGTLCAVRRVALLLNDIPTAALAGPITVSVYMDGQLTPTKTRTVNLTGAPLQRRWVNINISTLTTPGGSFSIGVTYADSDVGGGSYQMSIEAIGVEYVVRKQRLKVI